jgi:hypothetical protein
MATTFRADTRTGLYGLLTGFQTANPTMLHHTYKRRPGSFPDKFSGYVGSMNESIVHTGTTIRQRTLAPTIVLVGRLTEPSEEMADDMDELVDAFLDYCSARPHAISNTTITVPTAVEDVELDVEGTYRPAAVFTFGETIAMEGRL